MIKTPKISIIVPVYNVEIYLRECFDSIVNQTFKDFEVICINDGSTDNSLEILNEYAARDERFVVLSQENQGQGVARNKGVELARGEYIQFIDPDDWIELNMLETLYVFAKDHHSQVVKFNYTDYNDYSGKYKQQDFVKQIQEEYNFKSISAKRRKLNGAPRFSKEEIFEILDKVLNKKQTRQFIADEKAVDRTVIYRICNGKSYVNYYNEFMNASNR